ncbi:MAG: peptidoglycan DD-metalloendopeptidase family protein [Anaerolineae bacterium]|nr:peptidoglycan DD-metalloendopeptidase family protein [Anaerolineae bacterium]
MLVVIALVVFGGLVLLNSRPAPELRIIVPTQAEPTEQANAWQQILQQGFGNNSTPLPTVAIPTANFAPPTLAIEPGATALSPADVGNQSDAAIQFSVAATPTRPPATIAQLATDIPVTEISVTRPATSWQPPPLIPPISHDILGRDHYYFVRPVDSNATNKGLFYYPFGSDGPENIWRIHTGIDMPNDIGQTVRAAGAGRVVWAGHGFQNSDSYGAVVMVEHDFGFEGRYLYTLYAHLSAVLVVVGQHVEARDPVGLVGNTGRVSGPHVHFEVRVGDLNSTDPATYGDTYNPVLWMAPYVGTGVIAGRITDGSGRLVMDADITIRNWATGLNVDTTTTYIFQNTTIDVNSDPVWNENFAVGDLPEGRYTVIANIYGEPVSRTVNVLEGTTSFVDIAPGQPTPQTDSAGS